MKIALPNIPEKINIKPRTDRTKQTWAEDWNELMVFISQVQKYLHFESGDIDLANGLTSFTITFNDSFEDTNYRVLGGAIYLYKIEEGGFINELPIKNIVKYVDKVTFQTLDPSDNYKLNYKIGY